MGEYSIQFTCKSPFGVYEITKKRGSSHLPGDPVIWSRPATQADENELPYPADVRAKYEELLGRPEFLPEEETAQPAGNIVEFISDESAFDQACAYGNRVESHAVYCHNERWLYAPRKCRRTWYTGGEIKDEDCRGFKLNPAKST